MGYTCVQIPARGCAVVDVPNINLTVFRHTYIEMLPGIYNHSRKLSSRSSISVLPGRAVDGPRILLVEVALEEMKGIGQAPSRATADASPGQGSPVFLWLTF